MITQKHVGYCIFDHRLKQYECKDSLMIIYKTLKGAQRQIGFIREDWRENYEIRKLYAEVSAK